MGRRTALACAGLVALLVLSGLTLNSVLDNSRPANAESTAGCHSQKSCAARATGIHKIRHVVIIMQENRSFDSYFGTFPGADGIPARNGVRDRLLARSDHRSLCASVPRSGRCQRRRAAWSEELASRHQRRHDERVRRSGRHRCPELRPERQQPQLQPVSDSRRDGLSRRARDPQLLGLRAELRARRPHVRAGAVMELRRPPLHGLRLVGLLHEIRGAIELPRQHQPEGLWQAARSRRVRAPSLVAGDALRLDRPDISAAPPARQLGLLHRAGAGGRLPQRSDDLQAGAAAARSKRLGGTCSDSGHLEPAAGIRHRAPRPPDRQRPGHLLASTRRRATGGCRRSPGWCPIRPTPSTRRPASPPARRM